MSAREEFEKFIADFTGRDIDWHRNIGNFNDYGEHIAYQCWLKNYEDAEVYRKAKKTKEDYEEMLNRVNMQRALGSGTY